MKPRCTNYLLTRAHSDQRSLSFHVGYCLVWIDKQVQDISVRKVSVRNCNSDMEA